MAEEEQQPIPADENALVFDLSMKKKKKKRKPVEGGAETAMEVTEAPVAPVTAEPEPSVTTSVAPVDENDPASMFADLKKKKKKKVVINVPGEETPAPAVEEPVKYAKTRTVVADLADDDEIPEGEQADEMDEDDNDDDEGGESNMLHMENPDEEDGIDMVDDAPDPWLGTDRDYTYDELLARVFKILRANNPSLAGEKRRYTIVPPNVVRDGNKKTVFVNLLDICKRMRRSPEHVIQFIFTELGTTGSTDGLQRLTIKGKFMQKQIENVLRRYITDYVTCKTCKSPDTQLTKENRLFFLRCESCGSTRSVAAIKTGFVAQTAKRARTRAAAP